MKATVYVRLKPEVLDVQGRAVEKALATLGFDGIQGARVGKLIEIEFSPGASDVSELESKLRKMCDELLANPVIEDYAVELRR
jgi:phosphoribosylformylglycinamidine synthase subunit PurS